MTKSELYMKTGDDQLSSWTEKKLQSTCQSQICTKKKRSCSGFGGLLPIWSTTAFWILVKPLYLRSMPVNWWDASELQCLQPALVNRKGSILHNNTQLHVVQPTFQKLNELGCKVLPPSPYLPDLLPTDYCSFKHLDICWENTSQPARGRKQFPRIYQILKHRFLCYRNKQTYFLLTKMCLL